MKESRVLVLDTNVWVYTTRLLSTPLGAAVLFAIHQSKHKLLIPEVIEAEIRKHTVIKSQQALNDIVEGYRLIEQLMGRRDDFRVPSEGDFIKRFDDRLNELGDLIYKTDFTLKHAKGALDRVMEGTPPNGPKNQQFKDSAIWESILEAAETRDVDFITEDKAFFHGANTDKGELAANLKKEASKANGMIRVFYKIDKYLEAIGQYAPQIDQLKQADALCNSIRLKLNGKGYTLGDPVDIEFKTFLTEKLTIVAVEFSITFVEPNVSIPDSEDIIEARLIIRGSFGYNIDSYTVIDLDLTEVDVFDKSGERVQGKGITFLKLGTVYSGRREIPYQFKNPI